MCKKIFFLITIKCLLLSGCAGPKHFGPYTGRVIHAETGEPIEGAVVFMKIMTYSPNVGGWQTHFADAKEVLTDSKGEYLIDLWGGPFEPHYAWWPDPIFTIFKPGFGSFPSHADSNVDIVKKDTSSIFPKNAYVTIKLPRLRTRDERRKNLSRARDYDDPDIPYNKRKIYFQLTNEESIAVGLKPLPTPKE